jgi:hypothetical protein
MPILLAVDFLLLERLDERLRLGVVIGVAHATHADLNAVLLKPFHIVRTRILHPPVGVVDHPRFGLAALQGHLQSSQTSELFCQAFSKVQAHALIEVDRVNRAWRGEP